MPAGNLDVAKAFIKSPLGLIEIVSAGDAISKVNFVNDREWEGGEELPQVLSNCINQLQEYFEGKRKVFDVKLDPMGTEFQKRVWHELLNIPYGKVASYGDIAIKLGDKKTVRAVGTANGSNPIAIIIPCHRVIGQNGDLIGYAGGLERKKWLLDHESPVRQTTLF
jgi:methylated-DNA-[protein]-cysteine S-methyltransferase